MLGFIRSTLNPARYQGQRKKPPLFEGWYFKLVDQSERHRYAIIPGVFLKEDAPSSHAFVQVLDGNTGRGIYQEFPIESFWSSKDSFDIRIGQNQFSAEKMSLDLSLPGLSLRGDLEFDSLSSCQAITDKEPQPYLCHLE